MSDRAINWPREIKALEVEIDQSKLNLKRNEVRVMESEDEIAKVNANSEAIRTTLAEQESKLAAMVKEHGK